MRLKFFVLENVPLEVMIGDSPQTKMKGMTDRYHANDNIKKDNVYET